MQEILRRKTACVKEAVEEQISARAIVQEQPPWLDTSHLIITRAYVVCVCAHLVAVQGVLRGAGGQRDGVWLAAALTLTVQVFSVPEHKPSPVSACVYLCLYMRPYVCECVCTCAHMCLYVCLYTCVYMGLYMCVYVFIHVCTSVCTYTSICV